ncbi:MAG: cytochrome c peroxidase [Dehalococcoidales bacterium]|nr:cytochrome c peroxidase [Dehalococcoidales bacterium]
MKKFFLNLLVSFSIVTLLSFAIQLPLPAAALETSFTITASATAGGTVSPSGNISVNAGANQIFTFTPNSGYTIGGIMIDDSFINPQPGYTFSNVSANHTIEALFTLKQVVVPPPNLQPLNQTPVPEPPNLSLFVKNKSVAVQLGKAFFWDMQAGSDGVVACATCHFTGGADGRMKNTVNPGADGIFEVVAGVNETLDFNNSNIFPFHERANQGHLQSDPVIRDYRDVVGSQGVKKADFVAVVPGSAVDDMVPVPDPVFNVDGVNVRQVTGRQAPTIYDAAFNFNQFWDGRASFIFNGENPFGLADPDAGVWFNDPVEGLVKRPVRIEFASLASQATGPALDPVEMSAAGRTFPELGRKMLSLVPLGKQLVSHDDSVLGGLSNSMRYPDGSVEYAPGLHDSYAELIEASFRDYLWNSLEPVTGVSIRERLPGGEIVVTPATQMEANFSLFWGLSIQLYESTLISDQTPFDFWLAGETNALTEQQKMGFSIFNGTGKCNVCHSGVEFTNASVSASRYLNDSLHGLIEMMFVADGRQVIYDDGFNNTSVTRTTDDIGRGGTQPHINPLTGQRYPLSFSALAKLQAEGKIPFSTPILDPFLVPYNIPVNAEGAFKVPGLRNIELTTPYFHNGGVENLDDVLDMYIRGGNHPAENVHDLDADIAGGLSNTLNNEVSEHAVIEFMKSLTDPRVVASSAPFDHPELFIPEGSPDTLRRIPGKDSFGESIPALPLTINPVTSPTNVATQTVSGTINEGLSPEITVSTSATVETVTVDGSIWSAEISGLVEGTNTVRASVTDDGVLTRVTATVTLDTTPPALTLNPVTSPTTLVSQSVSGTTETGAVVRISVNDGAPVSAIMSGVNWSFNAALSIGTNTISVTATDGAGNTAEPLPGEIVRQPQTAPTAFTANLSAGWSLLSTPVALEPVMNTMDMILDASTIENVEVVIRWKDGEWQQFLGADELRPLEAVYVKVKADATAAATMVPATGATAPPSRELSAGLNLVGPAPVFTDGAFAAQALNLALVYIEQAPGGLNGYTVVISPGYNQSAWEYVRGGPVRDLIPFKGYWVIMDNPDTLFGFNTTPLVP